MIDNIQIEKIEPPHRNWLPTVLVIIILVVVAGTMSYFYWGRKLNQPVKNEASQNVDKPALNELVPTDSKDPEDFLNKVKEKSVEIQKNYDLNLTGFAEKRWEKIFGKLNGVDNGFLVDNLKVLSQEVQKDESGNTIFKIKYRIESAGSNTIYEDFFYLVISEAKKGELGLADLKANVFLSEEDINNNLAKEGFAKITKIQ